eukprot:TRINITY_DN375_c0_g2_i4.p2 TRINITY_DN375_c0_g2~~TRINITY_DN375_c0_g2_i4.p2  ORF type:complete len:363 (+),score=72.15 TRINITY_DN375_c0_g2_i4:2112-3200(+)
MLSPWNHLSISALAGAKAAVIVAGEPQTSGAESAFSLFDVFTNLAPPGFVLQPYRNHIGQPRLIQQVSEVYYSSRLSAARLSTNTAETDFLAGFSVLPSKGLPAVVFDPVFGQEEREADSKESSNRHEAVRLVALVEELFRASVGSSLAQSSVLVVSSSAKQTARIRQRLAALSLGPHELPTQSYAVFVSVGHTNTRLINESSQPVQSPTHPMPKAHLNGLFRNPRLLASIICRAHSVAVVVADPLLTLYTDESLRPLMMACARSSPYTTPLADGLRCHFDRRMRRPPKMLPICSFGATETQRLSRHRLCPHHALYFSLHPLLQPLWMRSVGSGAICPSAQGTSSTSNSSNHHSSNSTSNSS